VSQVRDWGLGIGDWGLGTGVKSLLFPYTLTPPNPYTPPLQNSHQQVQFWQMGLMIKIENW